MNTLSRAQSLAKSADSYAVKRGHRLQSWRWEGTDVRLTGQAYCRDCGMMAAIDTKPAPNSIEVSGEAVSLACSKELGT